MAYFQNVPEEVLYLIFKNLELLDVKECREVCKAWRRLAFTMFLNNVNLCTATAVNRFISTVGETAESHYLNAVKSINISRSPFQCRLDVDDLKKLLFRYPNLERVHIQGGLGLLEKFNDEMCNEILLRCPKLVEFNVRPREKDRLIYYDIISKIRKLVSVVELDHHLIAMFPSNDVAGVLAQFPRLTQLRTLPSVSLDNFQRLLPVLEKTPNITWISIYGAFNDEENFMDNYLMMKTRKEQEKITSMLSKITHVDLTYYSGYCNNSLKFISNHLTGLETFHLATKNHEEWTDIHLIEFFSTVLKMVCSVKKFGYMRLRKMRFDSIAILIPIIVHEMFSQSFESVVEEKKTLRFRLLDRNEFDLSVKSYPKAAEKFIQITVKNEENVRKMLNDLHTQSIPLIRVNTFILEIKKKNDASRAKTNMEMYDEIIRMFPYLEQVIFDIPASYEETKTIHYTYDQVYCGVVHPRVEDLVIQATANGSFQTILNRFYFAFPNLKRLRLYYSSGKWSESMGEFRISLPKYALERLELDMTPVKAKTLQFLRPNKKQRFIVLGLEIISSKERMLFKFSLDLKEFKMIDNEDLKPFTWGSDYYKVSVTIYTLRQLDICMYTKALQKDEDETYAFDQNVRNVARATIFNAKKDINTML